MALQLSSCATTEPKKYPENQLEFKILRFRSGHDGLTNRFCSAWDKKGVCSGYTIKDYDLKDQAIRDTLNQLAFICKVGGKRYKIDPTTPRLRRDSSYKCGFLNMRTCWASDYLEIDAAHLRDVGAKCFSVNKYSFNEQ